MKCILVALVLLLGSFNTIEAINYDSLRPKFNYAILRELKNSGERDANNRPIGKWVEYIVDSGAWKESIEQRDAGRNLYPPHRIFIVRCTGEYNDGERNGLWTYYRTYDSQQPVKWDLMETRSYLKGQLHGPFKIYYSTGILMEEFQFQNGKENGAYFAYNRDGKVVETMTYINGEIEGKGERYNSKGVLVWSAELHKNFYHGSVKEFYDNGQLRSHREYKMGKPWNIIEVYSRYGTPLDKGTLKNGTGLFYTYDKGGSRTESSELVNGVFEGTFRTYYLNGNLESECTYRNDTMNGVYRAFYFDGGLMYLKAMVNDIVDGPVVAYYRSGKLKSENIYRKGKLWAAVYANDINGKRLDCGNVKMGSGTLISYDDSGRVSQKGRYSFGLAEGITEEFYPNGKTASTVNYFADMIHGECRAYFEDGTLRAVEQYNEGMLDGFAVYYHTNGKIYEEHYYYRGRLWEIISMRDSSGRKMPLGSFKNGSGRVMEYYPSGKLLSNREMLHGVYHGNATAYYENGKKNGEYQYFQDQLEGTQKEYWRNGVLAIQWKTGEYGRDEKRTYYHTDGKIWSVWEYENGLMWDVQFNNDLKGQPHDLGTFKNGTGTLYRYDEKDSVVYTYEFINGACLNCEGDHIDIF